MKQSLLKVFNGYTKKYFVFLMKKDNKKTNQYIECKFTFYRYCNMEEICLWYFYE